MNRSEPIGVAIFGVGRWGVHWLRNFLQHPRARVVAVVDPMGDRLSSLRSRFELDPETVLTSDWQAAMQLPDVKAVVVATPATTHYPLIRMALEQGHHVLAEKPLTLDVQEAIELCQLADQQQRQLVVDHTYLFHSAVRQGKVALENGRVGDLRYGYAARTHLGPVRQDVDALWDLAIHDLAIFNYWLGETPSQVMAQGSVWLQGDRQDPHWFPQGLSDLVWAKLLYPSGFQATIHLCWLNPDKQRRLCLVGSQGTLIFDEMLAETPLVLQQGYLKSEAESDALQPFMPMGPQQTVLPLEPTEPLWLVCDHFLDCIQTGKPSPISNGWVGSQLVKTLNALTASLNQNGKPVLVADVVSADVVRAEGVEGDR